MTKTYHGNGKLLLTGEYVVLDGALALALPTLPGQSLEVRERETRGIHWKSLNENTEIWFEGDFELNPQGLLIQKGDPSGIGSRLASILSEAAKMNPEMLSKGFEVRSSLEFPADWGLGSSSTLIHCIAQWFGIDPYELLKNTFGGSGYDIAAAAQQGPFLFQLIEDRPTVHPTLFDPLFKENLFFVYLDRKQNSRHSIQHYRNQPQKHLEATVEEISSLTHKITSCDEIAVLQTLIEEHEEIISQLINTPTIKSSLFPDYPHALKSLGGWGGDFILALGGDQEREYFLRKGYNTLVEYHQMIRHA